MTGKPATTSKVFPGPHRRPRTRADRERSGYEARFNFATGLENVRRLHAAGVRILAGDDAGTNLVAHGVSRHGELELLTRAGLTPAEALTAATSARADVFRLADRGRIATGKHSAAGAVTPLWSLEKRK